MKKITPVLLIIFCVLMTSCIAGAPLLPNDLVASLTETSTELTLPPTASTVSPIPPTPSSAEISEWKNVYVELLREKMQLYESNTNLLADNFDVEKKLSAFRGGGYPTSPFVYLVDIDCDDIPELIYVDASIGFDGDVYSYMDDSLKSVGKINFYPFGSLGTPLDKAEGLYSDIGYKGHYGELYYYTLVDGTLIEEFALEYNNRPEVSDHPGSSYSFENFSGIDYVEITSENISEMFDSD